MADETPKTDGRPSEGERPKASKMMWLAKTAVSFIALAAALLIAYYAIGYLSGSNYNLDALLSM